MNVKTTPKRFRSITVCSDTGGPFSLLYLGRVFLLLFSDTLYRVAILLPYPFWFFRYNEQREKGRNVQIWGGLLVFFASPAAEPLSVETSVQNSD